MSEAQFSHRRWRGGDIAWVTNNMFAAHASLKSPSVWYKTAGSRTDLDGTEVSALMACFSVSLGDSGAPWLRSQPPLLSAISCGRSPLVRPMPNRCCSSSPHWSSEQGVLQEDSSCLPKSANKAITSHMCRAKALGRIPPESHRSSTHGFKTHDGTNGDRFC